MTGQHLDRMIRAARTFSAAYRLGRASRLLAYGNLGLLGGALLLLACLWALGVSNPHDPDIIGRGVLIFLFSNALVIGACLLVAALTLAGLIVALVGLFRIEDPPCREGRSQCVASLLFHAGVVVVSLLVLILIVHYYPYLGWKFRVS
jgi:hypothetical protein